jgi:hypothetical protein
MSASWHPTRDGFGTVVGPDPDRLLLAFGVTLDEARSRFGAVDEAGELPVVVDRIDD